LTKIKDVLPIKIFNITAKKAIDIAKKAFNGVPATKGCQNEGTTFGGWTKTSFGIQTSTWSKVKFLVQAQSLRQILEFLPHFLSKIGHHFRK
jgi:hypothetical protein